MSLSSRFSGDLCKYLRDNVKSYSWKVEHHIGGPTRECVDVGGRRNDSVRGHQVLIEVELKREDPSGNILKVWTRESDKEYPKGAVLIQGFSGVYYSDKYPNRSTKRAVAINLGKKLFNSPSKVRYVPIKIPYLPRAGRTEGNGARSRWATWFGGQVVTHLRRLHVPLT